MTVREYFENDEDDPILFDAFGVEGDYCYYCEEYTPLTDLSWDGLCVECAEEQ